MSAVPRSIRLLLAFALLAIVAALWWFGRVEVPPLLPTPEANATPVSAGKPLAAGNGAASSIERENGATAAATWREPERRAGVDAANIYKNAFVLFNALTDAEKKMLRNPKDEVDADAAAALFTKIQPILALLREAMKAEYCDWGVAPITMETPLTYLQGAQDLAKLALWSAAYRLSSEPAQALEDLQTRARLGHHLADTLIGSLVSTSFEAGALELLRNQLGSLDAVARAEAYDFFARSTLDADLSRGMASEASMIENIAADLAGKTRDERLHLAAGFAPGSGRDESQARQQQEVLAVLDSPERLAAEVAFIRATEEKMAAALALPEAEFQAQWKAVQAEIANGHPLAQQLIPSLASIQAKAQQRRVERTLFTAGLDVLANGPAQLARYRDPATGGTLTYVPTPAGFELRSLYGVKGKPLTMSFAQPK